MLEPGQTFADRYRILRMLAKGGMGAVFEAQHTGTERRVALKLLWPQIMAVASAREKFELEAKVAARVNSDHIVLVSDAGFDERSQSPYLVMELLEGETLASRIQERGPLAPAEALDLLAQVASGLDAAHGYKDDRGVRAPIVHRDLKPENLFITAQRGTPLMKILDFGIAKVLSESTNVSQEVKGTPLYMAFEQVSAGVLSPQTDIWALGLITYYVLSGRRYWRSAQAPGAGIQSIFGEILSLPMDPPSLRLRQQGSDLELPAAFDAWLLECIDRDPRRRPASAGLAIEQLARALGGSPGFRQAAARPVRAEPSSLSPVRETGRRASVDGGAPREAQTSTAASLPAIASERSPISGTPRWLILAALALGVPLFSTLVWLLLADETPPTPAAQSAAPAAQPLAPTANRPAPSVTPPPVLLPQPVVPPPSVAPAAAPTIRPVAPDAPLATPPSAEPEPVDKPARSRDAYNEALRKAAHAEPRGANQSAAPAQPRPNHAETPGKELNPYDTTGFGKP